ncbi:hypothetical protein TNCV_2635951 [Trichonephila clavipes]|nr:hypothetical protein TNCV_2635951 [Trichonephila clavipes]
MWFRLALNTSTPSIQILIGEKGTHPWYAHQTGIRKITDKFKKGPTLTMVDTRDAKSVFIPEWIRRFKLDVKKVRREEVKYPFFESP